MYKHMEYILVHVAKDVKAVSNLETEIYFENKLRKIL